MYILLYYIKILYTSEYRKDGSNMQCFVNKDFIPIFQDNKTPKLLYVCKAEADLTKLPCVMQRHEDRLEILFIREGKGIHTIGGKRYHTKKGDILIFNSGVLHDERANPNSEMSVYNCAVTNLKLNGLRENCLLSDEVIPVLHCGALRQDIENIFKMMHSQIYSQETGAEEIAHHLLCTLISVILHQIEKPKSQKEISEYSIGKHIKTYIDEHCFEDLNLKSISESLNISCSYMCSVFKKTTGYTPNQYIINRRIGEAQTLLINSDDNVTEIAFKVGYHDSNYFSATFTKHVGMSPFKYRKRWTNY